MAIDNTLLEVWKNGGQGIVAAVLTAAFLRAQRVRAEVATHDRLAGYVDDDLGRWMRDRDRDADVRLNEIRQDAASKTPNPSNVLQQARGKVYKQVLHEYRDRGLRALRDVDELADQESWFHKLWGRRGRRRMRRPRLPEDAFAILCKWRDYTDLDVSRPELEPRLVELEADEG